MFGPLSRDDIIDFFKQSVEMGIAEGTKQRPSRPTRRHLAARSKAFWSKP